MDIASPTRAVSAATQVAPPRLPIGRKILYGVGQLGAGLQEASLTLVLFFYTQVIGLNAAIVGSGILAAGLFDGLLDALVGSWSDATRHRWGRRHPYLYFSAIPAGLSLMMLFIPPTGLSKGMILIWLFVWLLMIRSAMTFYLIPHWAMGAELSDTPRERTSLVASRIFFSFFGNGSFFVISLVFFRKGSPGNALLNPRPYAYLAVSMCVVTIVAKLVSALGTHKYIKTLPQPAPGSKALSLGALWREVGHLFRNKAFTVFIVAATLVSMGLMVMRTLDVYMGAYFWKLPATLVLISPGIGVIAFASGSFIWAALCHVWGKKLCYILGISGSAVILGLLPMAKIVGVFPANASPFYFPTIMTVTVIGNLFLSCSGVLAGAIVPDVMDDYERQTGRKVAGIITGFLYAVGKIGFSAAQAVAGVALVLIGLKTKALVASVARDVILKLGLMYGGVFFVMAISFFLVFRLYPLKDDGARLLQARAQKRSLRSVAGAAE